MAEEYFCPKCGRKMVARKGGQFYGCPAYFPLSARNPLGFDASQGEKQCKGSRAAKRAVVKREGKRQTLGKDGQPIVWNAEQIAIFDEFAKGGKVQKFAMGGAAQGIRKGASTPDGKPIIAKSPPSATSKMVTPKFKGKAGIGGC